MNDIDDNIYIKSYKYRLYPTEKQKNLINKYINLYRYVYNWARAQQDVIQQKKANEESGYGFYSFYDLCKLFAEYRDQPGNEWLKELPNTTARLALRDVVDAYDRFFKGFNRHPKFKSKKRSPKMFKTRNDRFYIDGDKVRFEGLYCDPGHHGFSDKIDLHIDLGYKREDKIKYIQPSISIDNLGNYWLSFSLELSKEILNVPKSDPIGIDMGIRNTLTLSNGEVYNRPNDKINRLERRIKRVKRHISRDIKRRLMESKRTKTKYDDIPVSNRSHKRQIKLRKLSNKVANIKHTWYHNTIKQIVLQNPEAIVIETIKVDKLRKANKKSGKKNA